MIAAAFARWCVTPVRESMSQWAAITLMHNVAAAASILLLGATAFVPALSSSHVGKAMVDRHGAEVALYRAGFVAPGVQELGQQSIVSDNKKQELGTRVSCKLVCLPLEISFLVKSCLYRFVREALQQGSAAQAVHAQCDHELPKVEVSCAAARLEDPQQAAWLRPVHDRIEAIGGELAIQTQPDAVSHTAQFKIDELEVPLG